MKSTERKKGKRKIYNREQNHLINSLNKPDRQQPHEEKKRKEKEEKHCVEWERWPLMMMQPQKMASNVNRNANKTTKFV